MNVYACVHSYTKIQYLRHASGPEINLKNSSQYLFSHHIAIQSTVHLFRINGLQQLQQLVFRLHDCAVINQLLQLLKPRHSQVRRHCQYMFGFLTTGNSNCVENIVAEEIPRQYIKNTVYSVVIYKMPPTSACQTL